MVQEKCLNVENTHISAESRRLHCTNFTSIGNEEWISNTCLSASRECKPPNLSVSNGMKWPDKPPELNLHQLEERLIALHIPFMQILKRITTWWPVLHERKCNQCAC